MSPPHSAISSTTERDESSVEAGVSRAESDHLSSAAAHAFDAAVRVRPSGRATTWRSWSRSYVIGLLLSDVSAAVVALVLCYALRPRATGSSVMVFDWSVHYRLVGILALVVWLLALTISGAYNGRYPASSIRDYRLPAMTAVRLMAAVAIISFVAKSEVSRLMVVVFFPTLLVVSVLARWLVRQGLSLLQTNGKALNRIVLAGDAVAVRKFADQLAREGSHGYQLVGVCVPPATWNANQELAAKGGWYPVVGGPDNVVEAAEALAADSIAMVGNPSLEQTSLQQIAWRLERRGVELFVAPDMADLGPQRIRLTPVTGMPLLQITEPRVHGFARYGKPVYERLIAALLLVIASPILVAIALAILVDSGRPVLYRQRRVGYAGREFDMLKFRSMVPNAESLLPSLIAQNEHDGPLFKLRRDPRVTRVGRFLRKYSLDELPQLLNVLKGDMVLVGPRPCLASETEGFGEAARRRFIARPGMTGLWQVSGRADIPWDEAVRLDLYYVENWSLMLDLIIVLRTLRVVTGGRSGY